jgi:hypothetical protein
MTKKFVPISTRGHSRFVECRVFERHSCELPGACQPIETRGASVESRWPATVVNISRGGISLHLRRRFERKAILALELSATDGRDSYTGLAQVVHVRSRTDGSWTIGCKFLHALSEEELHGLLSCLHLQQSTNAS